MDEYVGKICPYCKTEIKEGEEVKVCPECGIPHHAACCKMLFFENAIISLAISTSLTLDSADVKFSAALSTFAIVCSNLF